MVDPYAYLWLIPALPLAGFIALAAGQGFSRRAIACVGVGSVGAAAGMALLVAARFLGSPPPGQAFDQVLWQWLDGAGFRVQIALHLDALALVMVLVVTLVGFLIHVYSAAFMAGQGTPSGEGYRRFFAYMNLFVAAMLILVLADNLLLLYVGWEGVGLCSYLLIGFWYRTPANGHAAIKAFVVTRVGDAALAVALFVLQQHLGTLQIREVLSRAGQQWPPGSALAVTAAALLLAGAVGKSAQLPLQTWLPDAMAGPSPVSALIHAATMVTAGVYLIARLHGLFELAPAVQTLVATLGAATLLLAGCSALVQRDLKRVLAYSTMSQVGYMFLALGVGAWSAAVFHFVTHAVFKSLLFLAAGVVIASLNEEHDMFRMGGLRKKMPLVFWTFTAGALALASLPPATAGFSKEAILGRVWQFQPGGRLLYAAGLAGVYLTALYTGRMLSLTFCGAQRTAPATGTLLRAITWPLLLLAAGCLLGGALQWPEALGGTPLLFKLLKTTFGNEAVGGTLREGRVLGAVSETVALLGVATAYLFFVRKPAAVQALLRLPLAARVHAFWFRGWGFDALYDGLFVRPVIWIARINRDDVIDRFYRGVAWTVTVAHRELSLTQTGRVRSYAAVMAAGAIVIILLVVLL